MPSRLTVGIVEYGAPRDILPVVAGALRETVAQAEKRLRATGERIQRYHGLAFNPIEIVGDRVMAKGVAGIVALAPGVELEIRPKYAGEGDDWRADLLFLALFAAHGRIDPIRTIASDKSTPNSLADLIARTLLNELRRNHRTPLKARRRVTTETFEPLGEIDPDTLLNPGEEGWRQTFYAMSRDNEYWATIHAGAHALLGHVRDVQVAVMLRDAVGRWGSPAVRPSRIRRILPPRLSAWQRAYDLALELLKNAGFAPGSGAFATFEFTLDTWRTWEALVERSLVMRLGANRVQLQKDFQLGIIHRAGRATSSLVRPDALVDVDGPIVFDAKYKGNEERGRNTVSAARRLTGCERSDNQDENRLLGCR